MPEKVSTAITSAPRPSSCPTPSAVTAPGPADRPGRDRNGGVNSIFHALGRGYVVASPGLRGNGMIDAQGKLIGTAPAVICDYKAAVRWLRHNRDLIPGDTEKIITNGTSAGGAISSVMGATGNHPDYEPFLKAVGAADERDDIFAASCYCPITNLDHADMAYEWEFAGIADYYRKKMLPPAPGESRPTFIPDDGVMTDEQIALSEELKPLFPPYLNALGLTDDAGSPLTLDAEGSGSFRDYVLAVVLRSAQGQLDKGEDLSALDWLTVEEGKAIAIDFDKYVAFRTRMKPAPAFDNVAMGTPENQLFGTDSVSERHFTEFGHAHSLTNGALADSLQVKMMNPMNYIGDAQATVAKHYRIRPRQRGPGHLAGDLRHAGRQAAHERDRRRAGVSLGIPHSVTTTFRSCLPGSIPSANSQTGTQARRSGRACV